MSDESNLQLARDWLNVLSRPESGLLFVSGVIIWIVDGYWSRYGELFTTETMWLIGFSIACFVFAVIVAAKSNRKDGWKSFLYGVVISLLFMLMSATWLVFPFGLACGVATAFLGIWRGAKDEA